MPIELSRVTVRYSGRPALCDVSLRLPLDGFVAIVGPADAGKSTLLRLLAGNEQLDGGTVQNVGVDDSSHCVVSVVAKPSHLDAPVRPDGVGIVLIDDLRNTIGFSDASSRQDYLRQWKDTGALVLYATRDADDAFEVADHIGVFDAGRLLQFDVPARIYDFPDTEFVASYFGHPRINLMPAILEKDGQAVLVGNQTVSLAGRISEEFCRDITVGVRPQHISLLTESGGWRGRIVSHEVLGDKICVSVDVEGVRVRVVTQESYSSGETVFVRILPRHFVVFDDRGVRLDQL